jgi:hypothetical protein
MLRSWHTIAENDLTVFRRAFSAIAKFRFQIPNHEQRPTVPTPMGGGKLSFSGI